MNLAKYVCNQENCSATFKKRERYETHLLKHTGERPFVCNFDGCDKTYARSFHLKRHEKIHEKMFRCTLPGCSQILKTKATLQKHQDVYHVKKDKKKYKCSECSEVFVKRCMLTRHSYVHSGIKAYKCSESGCDKSFSMPSLLKRHSKRHIGYYCEESDCFKYFPRWSSLCKHKRECHRKTFICSICEKVFNYACNLKAHHMTHKLEKDVFQCTVPKCIRAYETQRSLLAHIKTFHERFTIACPEGNCHRFVKTEGELEIHIRHRHRRRRIKKNKKIKPKTPDFAEILSGFARGTKKDLNPQNSNIVIEEKKWDNKMEFVDLNSSNTSQEHRGKQHLEEDAQCSPQLLNECALNTQSEEKAVESKAETSNKEELCLDSPNTTQIDKCSKLDLNLRISKRSFDEKVESAGENIEIACFDSSFITQNNKHIINTENSKSNFSRPFSKTIFKKEITESKDEFIEIEVVCQSLQKNTQNVENQYLDEENYSNPKADQLWNFTDLPTGKVT